jgi:YVTN family beta-propeller protein
VDAWILRGGRKLSVAIEENRRDNGLVVLDFRLLGPVEAFADSVSVELGGAKQRAVLALLLLHANELLPRERLIDDLWGGDPPATARETIKVYVGRLRKLLSSNGVPGPVLSRGGGYVLAIDPEQVDVHRFRRLVDHGSRALARADPETAAALLREALSLWRGTALADLGEASFVRDERAGLEELRLAALEDEIEAELALGRASGVVPQLQQLTRGHPYRERFHRQLMLALYRSGRQADALEVYRHLRARLSSELALEPARETQELERAILAADPALTLAPKPEPDANATPPASIRTRDKPRVARRRVAVLALSGVLILTALAVSARVPDRQSGAAHRIARAGRVEARIAVPLPGGPWVGRVGFGAGSLWIRKAGDDEVLRVDPRTNTIAARIRVGFAYDTGIAIRGDDVWVTNGEDGTVSRIDALTDKVVATIRVGDYPLGVAVTKDAVWIANHHSGSVSRIDPRANSVVATVPISTQIQLAGPKAIAAAGGMVWVADAYSGAVVRVDPQRNRRVESIGGTGPACGGMVAFDGSVWLASACDEGTLTRIDTRTARSTARIHVPGVALDVAAGFGSIWVTTMSGLLLRIDPKTNRITARLHLNDAVWMTAGGGSVWVLDRVNRSVVRVEPAN